MELRKIMCGASIICQGAFFKDLFLNLSYIYIYTHTHCVKGKVPSFSIIDFVHALYLFQVLSIVPQTKVSWALSVRKAAP